MKPLELFGIETGKKRYHEEAFYGIAAIYNVIEKQIDTYLRPHKLSVAQFNVLMVAKHQGKETGISQVEIADRLIVSASNMTRLLDKLEKVHYIERISQKDDRRVNMIRITKEGSELLDQIWPGYAKKVEEITGQINKGEQKVLSQLVLKWLSVSKEA